MKSILTIIALTLLFSLLTFSQVRNHMETIPERLATERFREIHEPNKNDLQELEEKNTQTTVTKTKLDNGFLLIEEINQIWDDSVWVNYHKYSNTYNTANYLTLSLIQEWNGSTWVNWYKRILTYFINNYLLQQEIRQDWNGSIWVNSTNTLFTYDVHNNNTKALIQWWNGSSWVDKYDNSYIYDNNNNQTRWRRLMWNGSLWENKETIYYYYDVFNNQIGWLSQVWNYPDWRWDNVRRSTNTYDGENNLIEELIEVNFMNDGWKNEVLNSYTYDLNDNEIQRLQKKAYYPNWTWVLVGKTHKTYDTHNNLSDMIWQTIIDTTWINDGKCTYTYDEHNNLIGNTVYNWGNSTWLMVSRYVYTYSSIMDADDKIYFSNDFFLSNNYPNPFNPTTTIQYAIGSSQFVLLKIFDVLGSEIETLVNEEKPAGNYELIWNAANLPSGVYFYRLQAGEFVQTRKMILLK